MNSRVLQILQLMIIIFSIVALIAAISVYDYISTRSWQQVTSGTRNETVFERRNRAYGAYRIRRDYNKVVMIILFGLLAGAGVLYAATRGKKAEYRPAKMKEVLVQWTLPLKTEEEPEEVVYMKEEQAQSIQRTVAFVEPEVVDRPTTDGPEIIDPNTTVSTVTITDPGDTDFPQGPPPTTTTTTTSIIDRTPKGPADPIDLDEQPQYPGGPTEMKKFLAGNLVYPPIAVELELEGKCHLQFVVNKTGEVSDVKVARGVNNCPECDKEAVRVVKKMPKWTPGKIKGKAVDSKFNLPVKFELKDN